MYDIAESVGLPASFVDLRHDATHGPLPSMVVLRRAARDALQLLWDRYWSSIADKSAALVDLRDRVRSLLKRHGRVSLEGSLDKAKAATEELDRIRTELTRHITGRTESTMLAQILLDEAFLIPRNREHATRAPAVY